MIGFGDTLPFSPDSGWSQVAMISLVFVKTGEVKV